MQYNISVHHLSSDSHRDKTCSRSIDKQGDVIVVHACLFEGTVITSACLCAIHATDLQHMPLLAVPVYCTRTMTNVDAGSQAPYLVCLGC